MPGSQFEQRDCRAVASYDAVDQCLRILPHSQCRDFNGPKQDLNLSVLHCLDGRRQRTTGRGRGCSRRSAVRVSGTSCVPRLQNAGCIRK